MLGKNSVQNHPLDFWQEPLERECLWESHTMLGPWLVGMEQKSPPEGFPGDSVVGSTCRCGRCSRSTPWGEKIPRKRPWQPTLIFLLGKSHGKKSLAAYSPGGHSESDTAEHKQRGACQNREGCFFFLTWLSNEILYRGCSVSGHLAKQPWYVMKQKRKEWIWSGEARAWWPLHCLLQIMKFKNW